MSRWPIICLSLLLGCSPTTARQTAPPPPPQAHPAPTAPPEDPTPPEDLEPLTPHPVSKLQRLRIEVGGAPFVMEIADDTRSRARGLSGRTRVAPTEGMLFVYPEPRELGFWMNERLTDLDIIYVDQHGRIKSMHRMKAEPPRQEGERQSQYEARLPRYRSIHLVQFALEFAPGTIERLNLRLGDMLTLPRATLIGNAR